jgi:phage/plasmid-like protein (TIGR03299 family)
MAHMIDTQQGRNAFVYTGAAPWHGLGEKLDAISTADALRQGGLDFNVQKLPNVHILPDGNGLLKEIVSDTSFFTYRADTNFVLGSKLGKDYTVLQNIEALNLVDEILQQGRATIETAGSIDEGRKVFICLKVNEPIKVGESDIVNQYILLATSHDGSMSITATPTNVRVVCNNTLTAALRGAKGAIKIRHTSNAGMRLTEAAKVLGLIHNNTAANEDNYNQMREHELSSAQMFDYFGNIYLSNDEVKALQSGKRAKEVISTIKLNQLDALVKFSNNGLGQELARKGSTHNMWEAYNAITGQASRKLYKSFDDRANSLLFGGAAATIERAGVLALEPHKIVTLKASNFGGVSLN